MKIFNLIVVAFEVIGRFPKHHRFSNNWISSLLSSLGSSILTIYPSSCGASTWHRSALAAVAIRKSLRQVLGRFGSIWGPTSTISSWRSHRLRGWFSQFGDWAATGISVLMFSKPLRRFRNATNWRRILQVVSTLLCSRPPWLLGDKLLLIARVHAFLRHATLKRMVVGLIIHQLWLSIDFKFEINIK